MTPSQWRQYCRRDMAANRGYPKSIVILMLFRTAQLLRSRRDAVGRLAYVVFGTFYKVFTEWILGVELPASTQVGAGLRLRHGIGLVVNPSSIIGEDVLLRHGVTLGNRHGRHDCPVIGRGVEIGAGATIIGAVAVGEGARIGAGAVVVKDVPAAGVARLSTTILGPAVVRPPEEDQAERPARENL